MFQEWGFLLGEIWVLLLLAALLGLFAGWLIFGRSSDVNLQAQLDQCRADLADCRASKADFDGDGVAEGANEGTRPEALSGPRDGKADDLKLISGVGPKMEKLCNSLGFYHFDQIANWTADEVAWVDANLEGFKGRVTRDNWQDQARILAAGGETEFSARKK